MMSRLLKGISGMWLDYVLTEDLFVCVAPDKE